jgi:hypothetical protein
MLALTYFLLLYNGACLLGYIFMFSIGYGLQTCYI